MMDSSPVTNSDTHQSERGSRGCIFDIKRFALHDGPGIRTTAFLFGCPLNCRWCQNPEGLQKINHHSDHRGAVHYRDVTVPELIEQLGRDSLFYEQSGGGVTFSGGEPMQQVDFLIPALAACRQTGWHTAVDTCGFAPYADFERILPYTDLLLYDLKIIDQKAHQQHTGVDNCLIIGNLRRLCDTGKPVILRVPLIPGITDTRENLTAIAALAGELSLRQIDLLPFNRLAAAKRHRFGLPSFAAGDNSSEIFTEIHQIFAPTGIPVTLRG